MTLAGLMASHGAKGALARRPAWDRRGREPRRGVASPCTPADREVGQLMGVRDPLHEQVLLKGQLAGKPAPGKLLATQAPALGSEGGWGPQGRPGDGNPRRLLRGQRA